MLKRFFRFLTIISSAAGIAFPAAGNELRIGNAANGAHFAVIQQEAMRLAFSGKMQVAQRRIKPSAALEALKKNEFDLLILDRRFLPEKIDGIRTYPYAAEALCVYIHPGNPLGSLTKAEVVEIVTANAPVWRSYNGRGEKIQRIMLKSATDGGRLFQRVFGNKLPAPEIFRVSTFAQMVNFLNPAAIGVAPFVSERNAETIAVPVNDIAPDSASVRSGKYPLSLHYVLVTRENAPDTAAEFVKLLLTPENLRRLESEGMLPLWRK